MNTMGGGFVMSRDSPLTRLVAKLKIYSII
jgi:hypothetical protein